MVESLGAGRDFAQAGKETLGIQLDIYAIRLANLRLRLNSLVSLSKSLSAQLPGKNL